MVRIARGAHTLGYTGGGGRRVRFDPPSAPRRQQPGNLLTVGASGTGKSYAVKQLAYRTVEHGGRVVVLSWLGGDEAGCEYAPLAAAVHDSQLVTIGDPVGHSLDPTRIVASRDDAARYLAGAVQILCDVRPDSERGRLIGRYSGYAARLGDPSSSVAAARPPQRLLTELAASAPRSPECRELFDALAIFGGIAAADPIFGSDLPPLRLSGRLVVVDLTAFWDVLGQSEATTLAIRPIRDALVYLVAAAAVEYCRRDGFAALLVDDAQSLATRHPAAWQLVVDQARQSRYHNSSVWLATMDGQALGFDRPFLDAHFPYRLLFRPNRPNGPGEDPSYQVIPAEDIPKRYSSHEGVWVGERRRRIRVAAASRAAHAAAVIPQGPIIELVDKIRRAVPGWEPER